ncbi:hypothetical protein CXG81DRAFT_14661 [Caulochytrium protostelioides]|uniref:DNA topoisomerase I n=1 Tax=Caulochytrium protostelioides TaxID=1555241 RepID=A0A4P9X2X7_9FUNG|nr:hypothetical protein CXG81DRAFT_14661 [Caulochytrium protostelioides]|eukprot:RKO99326.1 hypothetical protein CXG81DRAFT_14661 [Caulochytrium protostelioides]
MDLDALTNAKRGWTTLEHNGPMFPPLYEPHGVQMRYNGQPVALSPASEEVATFFAGVLDAEQGSNPVFCKNFFTDFLAVIRANDPPSCPIRSFELCDFRPIRNHLDRLQEQKKAATPEEKLAKKAERAALVEKYGYAVWDGRREKLGAFMIEPPGLFRGRGQHPRTGTLKRRIQPEDVTINIGPTAAVPEPPPGHRWGQIVHDPSTSWIATWRNPITGTPKYVYPGAASAMKASSDMMKFEKARQLHQYIDQIRKGYLADLTSSETLKVQRAIALYFIDRLSIRAGNEKGDDQADTVGCCSLRREHVQLEAPATIHFDFLGKDSIRYVNSIEVTRPVFSALTKLLKKKKPGDMIFDSLSTTRLNNHLSALMPGLTAKVFRTYNASTTFQSELEKTPVNGSDPEKMLAYNRANRHVAILCNHQRAVSKNHGQSMAAARDKVQLMKYTRYHMRKALPTAALASVAQHVPDIREPETDMDADERQRCMQLMIEQHMKKCVDKHRRQTERAKQKGETPPPPLDQAEIEREVAQLAASPVSTMDPSKLEVALMKLSQKISAAQAALVDRDEGKEVSLTTSKLNYIDPRISVAWCKAHTIPIAKVFNAQLTTKFDWAMSVDDDWRF